MSSSEERRIRCRRTAVAASSQPRSLTRAQRETAASRGGGSTVVAARLRRAL